MTINRRERNAMIALLLAVVALAADKLLLPARPSAARAEGASTAATENGSPAGTSEALPSDDPDVELPKFPRRAASASDAAAPELPDVFDWMRLVRHGAARGTTDASGAGWGAGMGAGQNSAAAFLQNHKLQATLLGPKPRAVVDGRTFAVGDTLDGFVLRAVHAGRVEFVSDDATVVLEVPQPWNAARTSP